MSQTTLTFKQWYDVPVPKVLKSRRIFSFLFVFFALRDKSGICCLYMNNKNSTSW